MNMATANFTGDGQHNTFEKFFCFTGLTAALHVQLTFISILNSFLSLFAILGNALILIAFHKVCSLHPPSKLLLRSLATTDLCVGLISEPLIATYCMSVVNEHWNICGYTFIASYITGNILCSVSLLTTSAISVDRLLALLLGLRYKQVVTLKRTYMIVITFWTASTVFSAMRFWNPRVTIWYGIIAISLCLVTSILSYTKIFLTLRHHQNQVHVQQPNQANQIARYKQALSTAIWLQLTLVACYLPYGVVLAFISSDFLSSSVFHAWSYTTTLVYLNSSLNPILYCWKLEEVRQAVKDTIRQVSCHIL